MEQQSDNTQPSTKKELTDEEMIALIKEWLGNTPELQGETVVFRNLKDPNFPYNAEFWKL